jgi:tetratricopeptide (TPR) repeat protein
LEQQNKLEESCEVERKAIQLLPSDPRPLISLGWTLRLLEKYAEAAESLEKGLELKPHYAEADGRLMLAEVYEQLGQINKAATLWRQIIGMDSMYPSYDEPMEEARKKLAEHGLPETA